MTDIDLLETIYRTVSETERTEGDTLSDAIRDGYRSSFQKAPAIDRKILKQMNKLPEIGCLGIPPEPTIDDLTPEKFSEIGEVAIGETSAFLQISEDACSRWIDQDSQSKGLQILHIGELGQIPQQIIEKFVRTFPNSSIDRISSAAGFLARHLFLIYLPDSVLLEKPIMVHIKPSGKTNYFPVVLWFYAGKRSSACVAAKISNDNQPSSSCLIPSEIRYIVDEGGSVKFLEIQDLDKKCVSFPYHEYSLAERAYMESFICENGAVFSKRTMVVNLDGPQSEANLTGLYKPAGNQNLLFDTIQNHRASFSKSDLEFKGVLSGHSETLWKGNIYVQKGTKGVDGYQRNENILMEATARAESIPGLEILTDDVKCSHGVTLSSIDKDQLFYMKSRGIHEENAVQLISDGFLQSATSRINDIELKNLAENCLNINNK